MKLTVKTDVLQNLLTYNIASNNKMLPITCMMCLKVEDNKLILITTNNNDYMYADVPIENESFYAVIDNDVFTKLVSRTTVNTLTLEVVKQNLIVHGNGVYTIELPVDENGDLIKYPDPVENLLFNTEPVCVLTKQDIDTISKTNKANISTSLAEPCYTGYYMKDKVITSDRSVICCSNIRVTDTPILVNSNVIDALKGDSVNLSKTINNELLFYNDSYIIYTHAMEDVDEYNAEAVLDLVNTNLDYSCSISKTDLLDVLNRLSLFVSPFDRNCIKIDINETQIQINNHAINSTEVIPVVANGKFSFEVDIEILKKQVSAQESNVIELQYGSDLFIKLITDKVTEIIPLLTE